MYLAVPALASRLRPSSEVVGTSPQAPENHGGACAFPGGCAVDTAPRGISGGGNSGNNWNLKEAKLCTWLWKELDSRAGLAQPRWVPPYWLFSGSIWFLG